MYLFVDEYIYICIYIFFFSVTYLFMFVYVIRTGKQDACIYVVFRAPTDVSAAGADAPAAEVRFCQHV